MRRFYSLNKYVMWRLDWTILQYVGSRTFNELFVYTEILETFYRDCMGTFKSEFC
jgi:hypothetical protein